MSFEEIQPATADTALFTHTVTEPSVVSAANTMPDGKSAIAPPAASMVDESPVSTFEAPSADSMLQQFQKVLAGANGETNEQPAAPRVSRKQQAAEQAKHASQQPFVQRALELFEIGPGGFRYSPPGDAIQ